MRADLNLPILNINLVATVNKHILNQIVICQCVALFLTFNSRFTRQNASNCLSQYGDAQYFKMRHNISLSMRYPIMISRIFLETEKRNINFFLQKNVVTMIKQLYFPLQIRAKKGFRYMRSYFHKCVCWKIGMVLSAEA